MQHSETQARFASELFPVAALRSISQTLLDLIFPPRCVHCGRVDWHFCDRCQYDLENTPIIEQNVDVPPLTQVVSTGEHSGILQSAVQGIKYYGQRELAPFLAQRMARVLEPLNWTYDIVIPVPMHTQRLRERGYNQAKEISFRLAEILDKAHPDSAIRRERATRSQVGLSQIERLQNIENAFSAQENILKGNRLLLVDDVKTTGATMAACAKVALAVGATQVFGITVTAASSHII
jgi:ComF family protein